MIIPRPMPVGLLCFGLLLGACSSPDEDTSPKSAQEKFVCTQASECDPWEVCTEGLCMLAPGTTPEQEPEVEIESEIEPEAVIEAKIAFPSSQAAISGGDATLFRGTVVADEAPSQDWTVVWNSDIEGILHVDVDAATGQSEFEAVLSEGHHVISFQVLSSDGIMAEDTVNVYVCGSDLITLDAPLASDSWFTMAGAASGEERNIWNDAGYLEMTDNVSQYAAAFKIDSQVNPGNLHLSFSISCGKCAVPGECNNYGDGADGFAMSIVAVDTPDDLIHLFENHTGPGGGMGYVFRESDDGEPAPQVEALHLEFDTYYNYLPNHGHQDPTQEDHVQVHVNGNQVGDLDPDPDNEVSLWAEIPELEDNLWHDVTVDIVDSHIRVTLDSEVVIDGQVPNFSFKGGFLGFTAAAGAVFNYQRIDNIELPSQCSYPAP